ncbi:MAG: carbonic anhydrase [Victivallales bacterium]|nr:carbonic anhydrase [Victivallales bacterium]
MPDKKKDCICGNDLNCQCDNLTLALGEKTERLTETIPWQNALQRLKDGNQRFVSMTRLPDPGVCHYTRKLLCKGQWPFATILCCSDSRVPPEIVFDAGLGDLFIVRVAGNVLDSKMLGSIEYATLYSTSRLIMVMGHEFCGAVNAAVHMAEHPEVSHTAGINDIVDELMPAVFKAQEKTDLRDEELVDAAARENVKMVCKRILEDSAPLRNLAEKGKIKVVGAYKMLSSGTVEFFEDK